MCSRSLMRTKYACLGEMAHVRNAGRGEEAGLVRIGDGALRAAATPRAGLQGLFSRKNSKSLSCRLHANGTSQIRRDLGDLFDPFEPLNPPNLPARSPLTFPTPLTTITCHPMEIFPRLPCSIAGSPPSRLIDLHSTCRSDLSSRPNASRSPRDRCASHESLLTPDSLVKSTPAYQAMSHIFDSHHECRAPLSPCQLWAER